MTAVESNQIFATTKASTSLTYTPLLRRRPRLSAEGSNHPLLKHRGLARPEGRHLQIFVPLRMDLVVRRQPPVGADDFSRENSIRL